MKVSIVQMAVKYKNIEKNYLNFKKLIDKAKGDVIVFPETWTTGFFPKENPISEDELKKEEATVQTLTDKYVKEIDDLFAKKEKEITTI